ncbi:hypothetical protein [Flavobacterium piscis]|uniref:Uncharacterized protein n=1 Tax=Flavobacterium piscis TaxID=1114874 RepID=A0ABU1YB52_9FLAO|nr:hypothetical protein [Flavobacterium piscis]MDR7211459.1 hypothetical protein [Flavobacterium piscis]
MKKTIQEHILIRCLVGIIPLILFALTFLNDKTSGNDFIGSNTIKIVLGFGILTIWCIWILIEAIMLILKKQKHFAFANFVLLIILIGLFMASLYINHTYN